MFIPLRRSLFSVLAVAALITVGIGPIAAVGAQAARPKPPKACHRASFASRHKRLCHRR